MNIRVPQSGNAAKLAKSFLKEKGIDIPHSMALELVARLHGYADNQAMQADERFQAPLALLPKASAVYELRDSASLVFVQVEDTLVRIERAEKEVLVGISGKDGLGFPAHAETRLELAAKAPLEPQAASEAIKARYLLSGCTRHDVQQALDALREHCSDIFENETAMWEFLIEETHEDNEPDASAQPFKSTVVDWSRVVHEEDIGYLRFDKNPERAIINMESWLLNSEPTMKGNFPGLAAYPALTYQVIGEACQDIEVPLSALLFAEEVDPGLILLSDGRYLQLLSQEESGEYKVFSPALNRYL